jgi:thioesterase domain-containing protein
MSPAARTSSSAATVSALAEITEYLHGELPLTKVMGVAVTAWDGKTLVVTAPLGPNVNHTETAFGGSISSLGILAGYTLVYLALKDRGISTRVIIQKSTTDFLRPIDTEITATASVPATGMEEFVEMLTKKRRARLTLETQVMSRRTVAATHVGVYVAIVY